jgi:choline dehydrogenase-like flavoprotein
MVAEHAVDFWLSTKICPKRRTASRESGRDHNSELHAQQRGAQDKLYQKLKSMLGHLDMHDHLIPRDLYLKNEIGIAGCAHQAGTCRFGTDPKSSVLDINCKAHELDNLYVVDTSFFPSIGAVNPGLTAMANAVRVGDHLLARLK